MEVALDNTLMISYMRLCVFFKYARTILFNITPNFYQVLTGENWNNLLYTGMRYSYAAIPYPTATAHNYFFDISYIFHYYVCVWSICPIGVLLGCDG